MRSDFSKRSALAAAVLAILVAGAVDAQAQQAIRNGDVLTGELNALRSRAVKGKRGSLERLDAALRALPRPVISRMAEKTLWLDLRCLEAGDEAAFDTQLGALRP